MEKSNKKVLPIFIAVVLLLIVGAIGESITSMFEKIKGFFKESQTTQQTELELAPQI